MSRVLPGLLMACLWGMLLGFAGPALFWLAIVIGSGIAFYEYQRMCFPSLSAVRRVLLIVVSLAPVFASISSGSTSVTSGLFVGFFGLVLLLFFWYPDFEDGFLFLSRSGFGIFYIGLCAAHIVLLRLLPGGVGWLAVLTAITIGSDTGAYYVGRKFGRRKLCPAISPGKTIAGAVGGLLVGTLAALVVGSLLPGQVSILFCLVAGVILVPVGIIGDLTESVIKRATGSKDSGTLLAGHGGLLDRVDSLLLTAPTLYYLLLGLGT